MARGVGGHQWGNQWHEDGGAQKWAGEWRAGGGVQGGGGVQERPEPGSGGVYESGPLSSTNNSLAPASSEQQVKRPVPFVAHLESLSKFHASSVDRGLVRSKGPGSQIFVGGR